MISRIAENPATIVLLLAAEQRHEAHRHKSRLSLVSTIWKGSCR